VRFHMLSGHAALQIADVWFAQGCIGAELDGRALHESTARHDHFIHISRHWAGYWCVMGVHGCGLLDTAAETEQLLLGVET